DRSMEPVSARLDAIEKAMQAAAARQRADLAAFTERASEGLGRVGQRLREGFAALQQQTSEENQGLVERIRVAVSREIERVERLADEQAAQSAAVAERIARAVRDVTERTTSTVGTLRDTFDERIDEVARETQEAMAEASAQLAARQRAMLDSALRGLERKQRDLRLVEDPMPQPPAPPTPEPMPDPEPQPPPVPEPPAAFVDLTDDGRAFDPGIDDLQTSIEGLGDFDWDEE
ncbi:MAG TPA: hypothetical protein VEA19_05235, partial [Actinomycetota bacterium]|nr:hypothetical protein [Actinomycetota bacterium]